MNLRRIHRVARPTQLICFVVIAIATTQSSFGQDIKKSGKIWGPETTGLRIKLNNDFDGERNRLTLELQNVTREKIDLTSHTFYSKQSDFAEYLRHSVLFNSFPNAPTGAYFAERMFGNGKRAKLSLEAGESIGVVLPVPNEQLKNGERFPNFTQFTKDGQYFIRARLNILDSQKKEINLWSNEVPFYVGGSSSQPQPARGKILRVTEKDGETFAVFDLGSRKGVEVGDQFFIGYFMESGALRHWDLKVTKVLASRSPAKVTKMQKIDSPRFKLARNSEVLFLRREKKNKTEGDARR